LGQGIAGEGCWQIEGADDPAPRVAVLLCVDPQRFDTTHRYCPNVPGVTGLMQSIGDWVPLYGGDSESALPSLNHW
jgi:hypothetical protein